MLNEEHELIQALVSLGAQIKNPKSFCCPFHRDSSPSAGIYTGEDGRPRFKCLGCDAAGDAFDMIAKATGKPLADVLREKKGSNVSKVGSEIKMAKIESLRVFPDLDEMLRNRPHFVESYRYKDEEGKTIMIVARYEPPGEKKTFLQAQPNGSGWSWGKPNIPVLPIFNRPFLKKNDTAFVCEGEKDCVALFKLNLAGTTAPMGADAITVEVERDGKPGNCDWSPLAGKTVYLWGDFDDKGERHIQRIERILGRLIPRPRLLRIVKSDCEGAKDAADFIKLKGADADIAILTLMQRATEINHSAPLDELFRSIISGKNTSVNWPFPMLSKLSQSLKSGSVTILVGGPGAGKSFMLLQSCLFWIGQGVKIAILELEENLAFHIQRAFAVLCGSNDVLSEEYVVLNQKDIFQLLSKHRETLNELSVSMTIAPASGMDFDKVANWIELQAKAGARIIAVDPVSLIDEGDEKVWKACKRFMVRCKSAAINYNCSVVFATHNSNQPGQKPSLDTLCGGRAYGRLSSAVLYLEKFSDEDSEDGTEVITEQGDSRRYEINKQLTIFKARQGTGSDVKLGYYYEFLTTKHEERGIIKQKTPGSKWEGKKK
jgi:replicative DNA helicase